MRPIKLKTILMANAFLLVSVAIHVTSLQIDQSRFDSTSTVPTYSTSVATGDDIGFQQEFQKLLDDCPNVRRQVKNRCQEMGHTCAGRCGKDGIGTSCACDPYCVLYKDCCWDFQSYCPTEMSLYDQFLSPLGDVAVSCVNGRDLIIGRGNNSDGYQSDEIDHREPVFSVDKLHFMNKNAYTRLYGTRNESKNEGQFGKKIISIFRNDSIGILEDFFLTGRVGNRFTVVDAESVQETRFRMCRVPFDTYCSFARGSCEHRRFYELRSNAELCSSAVTNATVESYMFTNSKTFHVQLLERIAGHKCFKASREPGIPISEQKYEHYEMILIISFSKTGKMDFLVDIPDRDHALNKYLETVRCKDHNGNGTCHLTVVCIEGTIPIDLICRKPMRFIVKVYGNAPNFLKKLLNAIISFILETYPLLIHIPRGWVSDKDIAAKSGYAEIEESFKVKTCDFQYNGTMLHPITNTVIEFLRHYEEVLVNVKRVTLCILLPRLNHLGEILLCDNLVSNSKNDIHFLDHKNIPGNEIPALNLEQNKTILMELSPGERSASLNRLEPHLSLLLICVMLSGYNIFFRQ